MKAPKDRDLAQELVDFLLKDEEGKKAAKVQAAVEPNAKITENVASPAKAIDEQKTLALQPEAALISLKASPANKGSSSNYNAQPPIEFDLDLGDGNVPDVDFNAPSNKSKEVLSKNSPTQILERAKKKIKKQLQGATQNFRLDEDSRNAKTEDNVQLPVEMKASQATRTAGHVTERAQAIFAEVNNLLGGVEAIKVAQTRISQLEKERDQHREEIEKLLFTENDLKKRIGELQAAQENQEKRHRERIGIQEDEKLVAKERLSAKETELTDLKRQHEELQGRFQNEFRKIRVRERELENRQELLKAESIAVIHAKDEIILELKRQLEQLHFEIDNFRAQSADMNAKISEFYDRNNRTVKALRLALSVLEVGDQDDKNKKASGS